MPPKKSDRSAKDAKDAKGDSNRGGKPGTAAVPEKPAAYANDYTNKLKDGLRKQLQATKGIPEKLKAVD